jgi:hypothetical protein
MRKKGGDNLEKKSFVFDWKIVQKTPMVLGV